MTSKLLVLATGSHVFPPACHPPEGAGMDTEVDEELPVTSNDSRMLSVLLSVTPNLFHPPTNHRLTAVKTFQLLNHPTIHRSGQAQGAGWYQMKPTAVRGVFSSCVYQMITGTSSASPVRSTSLAVPSRRRIEGAMVL